MNIKSIIMLTVCAILTGGCDKPQTTNTNTNQPPPPVQAQPFHGQVYKSLNGLYEVSSVLTLISPDECEFLDQHKQTTLCKYTKSDNKLRVVTQLGQVTYFQFTDEGLVDNDRVIYFSPEGLAARIRQHQQEEADKLAAARAAEEKRNRVEQERQNCNKGNDIATFPLFHTVQVGEKPTYGSPVPYTVDGDLIINEVAIGMHLLRHLANANASGAPNSDVHESGVIFFSTTRAIGGVGESCTSDSFTWTATDMSPLIGQNGYDNTIYPAGEPGDKRWIISFKSEAEAIKAHDAAIAAFDVWKTKFPDVVLH